MRDRTEGLQKALAERAKKEVADITAILTELRETIEEKLDDLDVDFERLRGPLLVAG